MKWMNFEPKDDLAALILRVSVGSMFFLHGIGKAFVVRMDEVSAGFMEKGFPVWTNYFATSIEIVAGLTLLLGVYSRLSALILMPVTIGILIYHLPHGWVFHNSGGGWEYPQLILVSLIAIFFLGGGKYRLVRDTK